MNVGQGQLHCQVRNKIFTFRGRQFAGDYFWEP